MNLYAIEHPDGGKWLYKWHTESGDWRGHLNQDALLFDGNLAAKRAKDFGGTVVTFTLTRTPELREGARVVKKSDVMIVDAGRDWCDNADNLIVLPDGFYQPPNKSPDEVES